ncbi:MAG: hypothetical protein KatS3mg104_3041 [Phycisphaerae bacterium]|nr:MAG: hypothetical protein KatS3mg104_3041 [Phycisphaerae bacterium]
MASRKKLSRIIAGKRAKRSGEAWERMIIESAERCSVAITKIPSGARWVGLGRFVPVRSPFDFIATMPWGSTILFDAKRLGASSVSFDATQGKSSSHQLDTMSQHERNGAICGFLIFSERFNRAVFLRASDAVSGRIRLDDSRLLDLGEPRKMDWRRFGDGCIDDSTNNQH